MSSESFYSTLPFPEKRCLQKFTCIIKETFFSDFLKARCYSLISADAALKL